MGNRHGAETFTPRTVNPVEYPGLHWTMEAGKPEYTPNVGTSMVLGFGKAEIVAKGSNSYEIGDIGINMTFSMDISPHITTLPPPQFRTDEQAKKVVDTAMPYIHSFAEMRGVNIIVARHGRVWGLFPEHFLAEELSRRGFNVPMVFPKVGGRNRIQEHAILLLGKP